MATFPLPEPRAPRFLHKMYAKAAGYFWLPCPVCGGHFGGHEWLTERNDSTIHVEGDPANIGTAICPTCTRAGCGRSATAAIEEPA